MKKIALAVVLASASPAVGVPVVQESPTAGESAVASIGSPIWTREAYQAVPGVIVGERIQANWGSAEVVDIAAGSGLVIIRERRTKACVAPWGATVSGFRMTGWEDCVIDTDDDGRFDRVSFNDVGGARNIIPPVPYTRANVRNPGAGGGSFRRTLVFTGVSAGDLRMSYREFANDMSRPAFTEDLSFPLGSSFPQRITVKGSVLEISGVSGAGLAYRVISHQPPQ